MSKENTNGLYNGKGRTKACPRCGEDFECKMGSIEQCQCKLIRLDKLQSDYIDDIYHDCLCAACLRQMRSQYNILSFERRLSLLMHEYLRRE